MGVYVGYSRGSGGWYRDADGTGPYTIDSSGNAVLIGLGGSSIAPGTIGTDRSGIATTTTAVLMPANVSRNRFFIKNDSATDLYINLNGGSSIKIGANGDYFELSGYTGLINMITATGTAAFAAREL